MNNDKTVKKNRTIGAGTLLECVPPVEVVAHWHGKLMAKEAKAEAKEAAKAARRYGQSTSLLDGVKEDDR